MFIPYSDRDGDYTTYPLKLLDSDGNYEPAKYIGKTICPQQGEIHVICLYDAAGRLYPVLATPNGLVFNKLGILTWVQWNAKQ